MVLKAHSINLDVGLYGSKTELSFGQHDGTSRRAGVPSVSSQAVNASSRLADARAGVSGGLTMFRSNATQRASHLLQVSCQCPSYSLHRILTTRSQFPAMHGPTWTNS